MFENGVPEKSSAAVINHGNKNWKMGHATIGVNRYRVTLYLDRIHDELDQYPNIHVICFRKCATE